MATEQSQFSKVSKKQLFFIAEKLIDAGFPTDNPYNDNDYGEHFSELENIGKYFNMNVVDEDVQFFAKFLYINDGILARIMEKSDILSYEDLIIPVAETYELQYSVVGSCSYQEFLSQKVDAYDEEWVISSVERQRDDGDWDIYEGRTVRDTEYDNFDIHDFSFDDVIKVPNNNVDKLKESIVKKLLVENTSDFISKLDKQTLLKLKQIIESRLRSL
jgi:hypothetical protein